MFKESKGIEYALEVLRVLQGQERFIDSGGVCDLINAGKRIVTSPTYLAKILPRMAKSGLLQSSDKGYKMIHPLATITVSMVLNLCETPLPHSPLHTFCLEVKRALETKPITEYYNFNN